MTTRADDDDCVQEQNHTWITPTHRLDVGIWEGAISYDAPWQYQIFYK